MKDLWHATIGELVDLSLVKLYEVSCAFSLSNLFQCDHELPLHDDPLWVEVLLVIKALNSLSPA